MSDDIRYHVPESVPFHFVNEKPVICSYLFRKLRKRNAVIMVLSIPLVHYIYNLFVPRSKLHRIKCQGQENISYTLPLRLNCKREHIFINSNTT